MLNAAALISLAVVSSLPVKVSTLDGQRLSGALQSLSPTEAVVVVGEETRTLPVSNLHEVRPHSDADVQPRPPDRLEISVTLRDGSLLLPTEFTATQREAALVCPLLGDVRAPKAAVASIRLQRLTSKLAAPWQDLLQREHRDDMVVVRKGDALDHVGGVVGTISAESVSLLLEGQTIPIPRSRVFGVIYATGNRADEKPLCRFDLIDGQQLAAASARLEEDAFLVQATSGAEVRLAAGDVQRIDFSLGKIRSLMDVEPTLVTYPEDHPLYLADVWKVRRGRNSRGDPLLLGGQAYEDGLWIHSGTTLRYRLGRQFRRLRGRMGIDEDIGECAPTVGVVFRGDGRVLLETTVSRGDDVRDLDLDVEGVRELEIAVTSTDPHGICEHLDLVEARLVK
jgi:hypothetical protein